MHAPEKNRSFTQLIEFEIEPRQQAALVSALSAHTERLAQSYPGFLSANIQASDDGRADVPPLAVCQAKTRPPLGEGV